MSLINRTIILEQLNDESALVLLPTMIYLAVLLILGVIGNSCVIFYYRFKAKYTPHTHFIRVLAVFDLSLSTICMPLEIHGIRFFFMADDIILCKVHHFFNYVFSFSSLFVLLSIAIERYRGICQPFKPKITRTKARIACVLCLFFGVLLSSPMVIFHDIVRVNVTSSSQCIVEVRYCAMTKENSFRNLYWITNFGYLLGFVCFSSAIITLYILIYKQMVKQSKFRNYAHERFRQNKSKSPSSAANRCIDDVNTQYMQDGNSTISWIQMNSKSRYQSEETNTSTNRGDGNYKQDTEEPRTYVMNSLNAHEDMSHVTSFTQRQSCLGKTSNKVEECTHVTRDSHIKDANSERQRIMEIQKQTRVQTTSRISDLQSRKVTFSLILVTAVFILSYVPFVCLIIWRITVDDSVLTNMSDVEIIFYFIGLRSYLINSAVNPIVFGACNNQFREFFLPSLCNKCKRSF
ncbi:hypothetical protein ACJMK2_000400 [Sinanodonta woodiana]|uniref:G-protein coupled receptors family 1 profile domain-containing protein n=1 Tax=Sinanodonta woodiana TaxID=1069815 RepID=A0ABD3XR20_SINWO